MFMKFIIKKNRGRPSDQNRGLKKWTARPVFDISEIFLRSADVANPCQFTRQRPGV